MILSDILWALGFAFLIVGYALCVAISGGCFDPNASRKKRLVTVIFLVILAALCFHVGLGDIWEVMS